MERRQEGRWMLLSFSGDTAQESVHLPTLTSVALTCTESSYAELISVGPICAGPIYAEPI
jgi:hypothetical protein